MTPALRLRTAGLLTTLRRIAAAVTVVAVTTPFAGVPSAARADEPPVLGSAERPVRIMPLGDSITDGYRRTPDSYRRKLYGYLTAAGVHVDYVGSGNRGTGADNDNEGHSGWRIRGIQARIDEWMTAYDPDIVLLNIGTNDVGMADDLPHAAQRLSTLIDTILARSPGVRVVVAKVGVAPTRPEPGWRPLSPRAGWRGLPGSRVLQGRRTPAYNAAVPGVVAGKGPRVSLVDLSVISPLHTDDGLHPDAAGFRQQAYLWYEALRPLFPAGGGWPVLADPFPMPALRVTASARRVPYGSAVAVTGRLSGLLGYGALVNQDAELVWRRAGTSAWTVLRSARTYSDGSISRPVRIGAAGEVALRVTGGRAAGRMSVPVRVVPTALLSAPRPAGRGVAGWVAAGGPTTVRLDRWTGHGWAAVAAVRTASAWSFRLPAHPAAYRVVAAGTGEVAPAVRSFRAGTTGHAL